MSHAKYRTRLPQFEGGQFLTDGGLETSLVFGDGFDLPLFAAYPLVNQQEGRLALDRYLRSYCDIAVEQGNGLLLDTPTWRASQRWADELGHSRDYLRDVHRDAVEALITMREEYETASSPMVINGVLGPQDDGYNPSTFLSADEAEAYHSDQVDWFTLFGADMVTAITMTYAEEAIGIARAAHRASIPCVISFTVETDGRLTSGQALRDAIEEVDAATGGTVAYFMINCAHPDHFMDVLKEPGSWRSRIMGIRANASRMSHEELGNADELDDGDPVELGGQYHELHRLLPNLIVTGGCCGTDHRHIEQMGHACAHADAA